MEGEGPKRFERLAFRALAEGAISDYKAAELLGVSVRELNQRMEEPPKHRQQSLPVPFFPDQLVRRHSRTKPGSSP